MALFASIIKQNITETGDVVPAFSPDVTNLILSIYIIVLIVGILGNGLVLFAFAVKVVPVTPFMLLLLNLSIADLVIDVSVFPFLFWEDSNKDTPFICGVIHKQGITWSAVVANAATYTYISFVRVNAFSSKAINRSILKFRTIAIFVPMTWLFGIVLFIPHYFNFYFDSTRGSCAPRTGSFYRISSVVQSLLCWVIPVTILSINFIRTVRALWQKEHINQSAIIKHRKQITFLLLGLTIFFLLFSTPLLIFFIFRAANYDKFTDDRQGDEELKRFYRPVFVVALLNTIADPLLYAFCWKSFRSGFAQKREAWSSVMESNSMSGEAIKKHCVKLTKTSSESILLTHLDHQKDKNETKD